MTDIRIPQRAFGGGRAGDGMLGRADLDVFATTCLSLQDSIITKRGTPQKRMGTYHIAESEDLAPRMFSMDLPEGEFVLEFGTPNFRVWDVRTRTIVDDVSWSGLVDSSSDISTAYPLQINNKLYLHHQTMPTLVVTREEDGVWNIFREQDTFGAVSPLIEPRPNSVEMTRRVDNPVGVLESSADYFEFLDANTYWFIGNGWFAAAEYDSPTQLEGIILDTAPEVDATHSDWAGPYRAFRSLGNQITMSPNANVWGDTSLTLSGGDTFSDSDVGSVVEVVEGTPQYAFFIRAITSSTVAAVRAISTNNTTLTGPFASGTIYRLFSREYDARAFTVEYQSGSRGFHCTEPYFSPDMFVSGQPSLSTRFQFGPFTLLVTGFVSSQEVVVTVQLGPNDPDAFKLLSSRTDVSPLPSLWAGFASCAALHQARRYISGFKKNPTIVWGARTASPTDFGLGVDDDDALNFTIDEARGKVVWMASGQDLLVGTSHGEYAVRGRPITPSNVSVDAQTHHGGLREIPIRIAGVIVFLSRTGENVYEMSFRFEDDIYRAPLLTSIYQPFSAPLTEENTIFRQMSLIREPEQIILMMDFGKLKCLSYDRENNVFGWSDWRNPSFEGEPEDVWTSLTAVATEGSDEIWASLIRRHDSTGTPLPIGSIEAVSSGAIFDAQITLLNPTYTAVEVLHLGGRVVEVIADGVWLGLYTVGTLGDRTIDLSDHLTEDPDEVIVGLPIESEMTPQVLPLPLRSGLSDGGRRTLNDLRIFRIGAGGRVSVPGSADDFPLIDNETAAPVEGTTLLTDVTTEWVHLAVRAMRRNVSPSIRSTGPWPFEILVVSQGLSIED